MYISNILRRLSEIILTYPKSFLALLFLLSSLAIFPALQIDTNFNLQGFFPKGDSTIEQYQEVADEFGRDDNVIIFGFKHPDLLSTEVLGDIKAISDSVSNIENVEKVRTLWSAQSISSKEGRLSFDPYLDSTKNLNKIQTSQLKDKFLSDPFVKDLFINEEANTTALYLQIAEDKNNYADRNEIIGQLKSILSNYNQTYDFKISGIPYYRNQYVNLLNNEIIFYVSISSLLIILLLWYIYRSIPGLVFPILIVWLTVLLTVAILVLTGGYFEVLSSTLAPILLCVGVADSIHMISKYDDALTHHADKKDAIKEMFQTLGTATLLTSITTAIGFATLITSNVMPMKRFGLYAAIGVMVAYLVTIFLLPASLYTLPVKQVFKKSKSNFYQYLGIFLTKLNTFNKLHYRKIVVGVLFLTVSIGVGLFNIKVNGKVFDDLDEDTSLIQQSQFFSNNLSPSFPLEVVIKTRQERGINDPNFIKKVHDFEAYLQSYEEIERVTSYTQLLSEMHQNLSDDSSKLPDKQSTIAQYLLLLELNNQEALNRFTDFNYSKVRISANMYDVGSYRMNQIREDLNSYIDKHFQDSEVMLTGTTILVADLTDNIVYSLAASILLAVLSISIIMALLFKNVRFMLLSLTPNLIPLVITAGFMGYMGIDLKPSTAVIFTIAFGIAVDDSIHYLARLKMEMEKGLSLDKALTVSTQKTGRAIIITSLILLAGFGTLGFSIFDSTKFMGLLVGLTILTAVLADLMFLPSLFHWIKPSYKTKSGKVAPISYPKSLNEYYPERAQRRAS